jgi:flagellar protein FlaG
LSAKALNCFIRQGGFKNEYISKSQSATDAFTRHGGSASRAGGPVERVTAEAAPREVKEVERERPSAQEVVQAAADLSEYLSSASRSLQINVDGELRSPIVTVLDTDTDEVIRQIPSEELVALARFAAKQGADSTVVSGVLINEEG